MSKLTALLEYFETNLDPVHIDNSIEHLKKALNFEKIDKLPVKLSFPITDFKSYPMAETHEDIEKMMYNELLGSICSVQLKDDALPMIRANYGVGTMPSLFGLQSRIVNDNMPWVDHVDTEEDIKKIIASGIPNLDNGFGKRISETHEFYKEQLSKYPKCNEYIRIYHPDLQGPFDVAHLIWGSEIYMAMYDSPELIHSLMELITQSYIEFMKKHKKQINDENGDYNYHWGTLYKGKIVLRNDSTVNLSRDMYLEFVRPYDEKILAEFGSGSLHFCGRADQWVFDMAETKNSCGLNFGYMPNKVFGQTYLEFIRDKFNAAKVPTISYYVTPEEYKNLDRKIFNTGLTLQTSVNSIEEAQELYNY